MKIKEEHYLRFKDAIEALLKKAGADSLLTHKENLKTDPRVKDLEKRFRWDLFWMAQCFRGDRNFMDEVYKYANDDHIDTALRKIVKELQLV